MIRIAVFGSNSLLLAGLVGILNNHSHLQVVGSFVDELDIISLEDCRADLLLLEQTPNANWYWLEQWMLTTDFIIAGILLIDSLTTEGIAEYLTIGFRGFLPRLIDSEEIIAAIDAVMAGLIVIHPELATFDRGRRSATSPAFLRRGMADENTAITPLPQSEIYLTPREIEILQLLGAGLDNKAIASKLQISKHTVKFHLSSIFSKLDVSSRTEAVTFGLRQGLIRL